LDNNLVCEYATQNTQPRATSSDQECWAATFFTNGLLRRLNPRAFHAEAGLSSRIAAAFAELSFQFENQELNAIIAYLDPQDVPQAPT
jgi:hypothetical protein